jgi:DNA-directed RNA polymerase specialized sigma24 family protein
VSNDAEVGDLAADDSIVTATNRLGRKVPNLVVRGMDEREIFAQAPLIDCDRVHWDTVDDFDPRALLADLPMDAYTRRWSDGQHRVWVPKGRGFEARELIKEWCVAHDVEPVNMRVEQQVPFRDLDKIPGTLFQELVAAAVDWIYPRTYTIRRRIVADLDLVEDQDVRSMMYLFISDHADRYDADRVGRNGTLNFTAFILGKLRTWPQDAARTAYGRNVVGDRVALNRLADRFIADEQRLPTEGELAEAMNTSVTDLRRREQAISELSSMRNYQSLVGGAIDPDSYDQVQVASDETVEEDVTAYTRNAMVTKAILEAVSGPSAPRSRRAQDPLALAAVYLSFWEGLSRPEVARELDVLPKTVAAALTRVMGQMEQADLS